MHNISTMEYKKRLYVSLLNSESSPSSLTMSVTDYNISDLIAPVGSPFIQEGNAAIEISDIYVNFSQKDAILAGAQTSMSAVSHKLLHCRRP